MISLSLSQLSWQIFLVEATQLNHTCWWETVLLCGRSEEYPHGFCLPIGRSCLSGMYVLRFIIPPCPSSMADTNLTIRHVQLRFVAQNPQNQSGRLHPCQHEISALLFYNLHMLLALPLWDLTLLNCAVSKICFSGSASLLSKGKAAVFYVSDYTRAC